MAKGKIEVIAERCKSCQYCIKFCPKGILALGEDLNAKGYEYVTVTDPEECTGCATCARICPDGAIVVYRERS